ncbi:hypothetical protein [Vibrio metschnikovii]|nr:hypothetical protein [Vibrio metschnikovii]
MHLLLLAQSIPHHSEMVGFIGGVGGGTVGGNVAEGLLVALQAPL